MPLTLLTKEKPVLRFLNVLKVSLIPGFLAAPKADGQIIGWSWGQMPSAQERRESAAHGLCPVAMDPRLPAGRGC